MKGLFGVLYIYINQELGTWVDIALTRYTRVAATYFDYISRVYSYE